MKRQHPLVTTFGILTTAALLAGLFVMLLVNGGQAFSPGELSEMSRQNITLGGFTSHAAFEEDCQLCHQPLQTKQDALCLRCHEKVQLEIENDAGAHHGIQNVEQCAVCHHDHLGRDFNITHSSFEHYNHNLTQFSLVWHQVDYDASPIDCHGCHTTDGGFALDQTQCALCHAKDDIAFVVQHTEAYGEGCIVCHDGVDSMANFDHDTTPFPLEGKHLSVSCDGCHSRESARPLRVSFSLNGQSGDGCVECHAEPDQHKGQFSSTCQECHTPVDWSPANLDGKAFSHLESTRFSLAKHASDYKGNPITCKGCHTQSQEQADLAACTTCHEQDGAQAAFMNEHALHYGPDCIACHDGGDRMNGFRHENLFPLEGRHAELECLACHVDYQFEGLAAECAACHAEPEIHAGFFGLNCQYCHGVDAWTPAQLQQHSFPIEHGGQGDSDCATCHVERYNEYTCYGCHAHLPAETEASHLDAAISLEELRNCVECHPSGAPGEAQQ